MSEGIGDAMGNREHSLPPGQVEVQAFRRFGLPWFTWRFPTDTESIAFDIVGDVARTLHVDAQWPGLPRVEQVSDFHCVTTWSNRGLRWSGVRFRDVHALLAVAEAGVAADAGFVVLRGQDGYRTSLPLADLLADDVLLADRLDGEPLSMEHGAPLRLVAPAHYGYKNVKHIAAIEFLRDGSRHRFPGPGFMEHPRARVAFQERGKYLPAAVYRALYRPLIGVTSWMARVFAERFRQRRSRENAR